MEQLKDVVQYCAENIVDWDIKSEMAVRMIGRHMPIDPGFRNEIEACIEEWCDDHEVSFDEVDWDDAAEEVVLWVDC